MHKSSKSFFIQKQPPSVLFKKAFLKICLGCNFFQKDILAQVFLCEFLKTFLQSNSERLSLL